MLWVDGHNNSFNFFSVGIDSIHLPPSEVGPCAERVKGDCAVRIC